MKVLLLEDDHETAEALERGLTREGHAVQVARDVEAALAILDQRSVEVAILDVMVPGGSGYDVLKAAREATPPVPALMLTARGTVDDRVEGLDRGADDYLVKPFSFAELAARLRTLARRQSEITTTLTRGELSLDLPNRTASVGNRRIDLTPTEFGLLVALVRAQGQAVTRQQLLHDVWSYDFDPGTNIVDVHVNRLRRKLEDVGVEEMVQTVRGQGYAIP